MKSSPAGKIVMTSWNWGLTWRGTAAQGGSLKRIQGFVRAASAVVLPSANSISLLLRSQAPISGFWWEEMKKAQYTSILLYRAGAIWHRRGCLKSLNSTLSDLTQMIEGALFTIERIEPTHTWQPRSRAVDSILPGLHLQETKTKIADYPNYSQKQKLTNADFSHFSDFGNRYRTPFFNHEIIEIHHATSSNHGSMRIFQQSHDSSAPQDFFAREMPWSNGLILSF